MKKSIFYLVAFVLIAVCCKKSGTDSSAVRYEFNSDVSAEYKLEYSIDNNTLSTETITGTSWTKTVSMVKQKGIGNVNVAKLTVYPPAAWANTATSANVMLKIFVDNNQKIATEKLLNASHINTGVFSLISF